MVPELIEENEKHHNGEGDRVEEVSSAIEELASGAGFQLDWRAGILPLLSYGGRSIYLPDLTEEEED